MLKVCGGWVQVPADRTSHEAVAHLRGSLDLDASAVPSAAMLHAKQLTEHQIQAGFWPPYKAYLNISLRAGAHEECFRPRKRSGIV